MPRIARTVFDGVPHPITQRGNRREDVLFTDADRHAYLEWMREYCAKYQVHVLAICLMTNHLHVAAVAPRDTALENLFRPFMRVTPQGLIGQEAGKGICGKAGFSLPPWTCSTCGRRCDMCSAIPCGHGW